MGAIIGRGGDDWGWRDIRQSYSPPLSALSTNITNNLIKVPVDNIMFS